VTADNTPPIPSGWTRIVVQVGELTNRLDVPSDKLDACVDDFECSFSMPLRTYRNTLTGDNAVGGIARQAAMSGYNVTVGQAALWLLLFGADRVRLQAAREELWRLVVKDGGACIAATCSGFSRGWSFEVSPTSLVAYDDAAPVYVQ
jgi:hypothetical protein